MAISNYICLHSHVHVAKRFISIFHCWTRPSLLNYKMIFYTIEQPQIKQCTSISGESYPLHKRIWYFYELLLILRITNWNGTKCFALLNLAIRLIIGLRNTTLLIFPPQSVAHRRFGSSPSLPNNAVSRVSCFIISTI